MNGLMMLNPVSPAPMRLSAKPAKAVPRSPVQFGGTADKIILAGPLGIGGGFVTFHAMSEPGLSLLERAAMIAASAALNFWNVVRK